MFSSFYRANLPDKAITRPDINDFRSSMKTIRAASISLTFIVLIAFFAFSVGSTEKSESKTSTI